jgi:lactate permease
MKDLGLLIAIIALFVGVFVFKRLWLGALVAVLIVVVSKLFLVSTTADLYFNLANSFLITFELALLIFGAYLFYNILIRQNHFKTFTEVIGGFSSKLSIMFILGWFLCCFMEGIVGFGIPAMLIAPFMLAVGFRPLTSIILPLANISAVTFGALATPLKIGLGITSVEKTITSVVFLNIFPILFMPFVLAILYSQTENIKINWKKEWKMIVGAGICFVIPYVLVGLFIIEFPSVAAGAVGLVLFLLFFVPSQDLPSIRFWWQTFYPYILFIALLLVAKFSVSTYSWQIHKNLKSISFFQPGLVFIITALFILLLTQREYFKEILIQETSNTIQKITKSLFTIFLLVTLANVIKTDLTTFTMHIFEGANQQALFLYYSFMGAMGSFITGSATMSNLLLVSAVKASVTETVYVPLAFALLHIGSAIGNAISFQNIIMVKAVIDAPITESEIIKRNVFVVLFYLFSIQFIRILFFA